VREIGADLADLQTTHMLGLIWLAESTADCFLRERETLLAGWLIWLIISSEQAL
jgi:hypothetical protein